MSNAEISDIPITPPEVVRGLRCEEANMHGIMKPGLFGPEPAPCGRQATAIVWHGRPGERQYAMCEMCTDHSVRNRGGRLLLVTNADARLALMRHEYGKRSDL